LISTNLLKTAESIECILVTSYIASTLKYPIMRGVIIGGACDAIPIAFDGLEKRGSNNRGGDAAQDAGPFDKEGAMQPRTRVDLGVVFFFNFRLNNTIYVYMCIYNGHIFL